jgi:L-asparagine oxygenase
VPTVTPPHPEVPVVDVTLDDIGAAIDHIKTGPRSGATVLRGLPVGDVPPTPSTKPAPRKVDRTSETMLFSIASWLGEPVGYVQEHDGGVVQDLYPLRESAGRQVSTSSTVQLAFHTETAFHPHKPRYVLLLCLRSDPAAATTLCSVHAVLPRLAPATIKLLEEPRFRTGVDESFGAGSAWLSEPAPVLRHREGRIEFTYDDDLTISTDTAAAAALTELSAAIQAAQTTLVLDAGDLLVVDNHVAVHGRSPFPARYDGTDRWLQRTFVVDDLAPSAAERRGRVITTPFC